MSNDIIKTDEASEQEQEVVTPPKKSIWMIFFVLAIGLMAIAALSISGVIYNTTLKIKTREISDQKQTLSQMQSLEAMVKSLQEKEKVFNDSFNNLTIRLEQLAENLQTLSEKQRDSSRDWTFAEIEYLIIIAMQRLALEGDVKTAATALQSADNRLKDLADPSLLPIRKQLAADINALRSIDAVDIAGISLFLADTTARVETLPLKEILTGNQAATETPAAEAQKAAPVWRKMLTVIWQELKSLVKISKAGQELTISLLPEERYYLRQNLRLQLEVARLAVMRRDSDNFNASITLINAWLEKYFDTANSGVMNILDTLAGMKGIDLNPSLPDIQGSLDALRARNNQSTLLDSAVPDGAEVTPP